MAKDFDCSKCYHKAMCAYRMTFKDTIRNCNEYIPTADVVEVKHGKWMQKDKNAVYHWRYNCSICDEPIHDKIKPYNYCPNCGAKMDGKDINVSTK